MTRFSILAVIALSATAANAFAPSLLPTRTLLTNTAHRVLLSDEETASILEKAHDCAEGECSIDDVSDLIADLQTQQKEMNDRLAEIMNMVSHLQNLNEADMRKKDDVRAYVRDLLRVFDTKSSGFATGFSGDIGDGPKTAYDVLNPKPWKPSSSSTP